MLKLIIAFGIILIFLAVWLVWAWKSGNLSHRVTHDGTWDDGRTVHQREKDRPSRTRARE